MFDDCRLVHRFFLIVGFGFPQQDGLLRLEPDDARSDGPVAVRGTLLSDSGRRSLADLLRGYGRRRFRREESQGGGGGGADNTVNGGEYFLIALIL